METLPDRNEYPGARVLQRLDCQWIVVMEYAESVNESIVDFELHDHDELVLLVSSASEYSCHNINFEAELVIKSLFRKATKVN
jgi:hypothetical protein